MTTAGKRRLIEENLAAHDLMYPGLIHLQLPQRLGKVDGVAAGDEKGWRALQHRHVRTVVGDRRNDGGRRGPRADDDHLLILEVEVHRPGFGVHQRTFEGVHARPGRHVALGVPVVALAHPQEVGSEIKTLIRIASADLDGPEIMLA